MLVRDSEMILKMLVEVNDQAHPKLNVSLLIAGVLNALAEEKRGRSSQHLTNVIEAYASRGAEYVLDRFGEYYDYDYD